jgi:hypothetical protein
MRRFASLVLVHADLPGSESLDSAGQGEDADPVTRCRPGQDAGTRGAGVFTFHGMWYGIALIICLKKRILGA